MTELLHRKMKFRQFANDACPFSQGEAAKAIADNCKANRILAVGDNMGEHWTDKDDAGGLLYVRLGWRTGLVNMVEVVYLDTGISVNPMFRRKHGRTTPGVWEHFVGDGKWVKTKFEVEGISVEQKRCAQCRRMLMEEELDFCDNTGLL